MQYPRCNFTLAVQRVREVVDALPEEEEGTVNISTLDRTMYADMMGAEDGTYENALQKINAGDFITLYTSLSLIHI